MWNGGGNIISPIRRLSSLVIRRRFLGASTLSCRELSSLKWGRILAFVRETGRRDWRRSGVVRWGGFEVKRQKGPEGLLAGPFRISSHYYYYYYHYYIKTQVGLLN